jgi:uncharacterized Zn-finger protein
LATHGGEDAKVFACKEDGCGKRFSRRDALKSHMATHAKQAAAKKLRAGRKQKSAKRAEAAADPMPVAIPAPDSKQITSPEVKSEIKQVAEAPVAMQSDSTPKDDVTPMDTQNDSVLAEQQSVQGLEFTQSPTSAENSFDVSQYLSDDTSEWNSPSSSPGMTPYRDESSPDRMFSPFTDSGNESSGDMTPAYPYDNASFGFDAPQQNWGWGSGLVFST